MEGGGVGNSPFEPERIKDWYWRSLDSALKFVNAVGDHQWSNETPCAEWDVAYVVNHLVYENRWAVDLLNGKTIEQVGEAHEGDLVGSDPRAVYESSANDVKKVLVEPGVMDRTCHISSGPTSAAEYSGQLFLDTLVHGWDIAIGSGQDAGLDGELVTACIPLARMVRQLEDASNIFAAAIETKQDASPQTSLLALLGRNG